MVGVFDGHGPFGTAASRVVRASLAASLPRLHAARNLPPQLASPADGGGGAGGDAVGMGGRLQVTGHQLQGQTHHSTLLLERVDV